MNDAQAHDIAHALHYHAEQLEKEARAVRSIISFIESEVTIDRHARERTSLGS